MNNETQVVSLDAPELSIAEYRTLRGGGEVAAKQTTTTEAIASAAEPVTTDEAGTAATTTEEAGTNSEEQLKQGKGLQFRFSELTSKIKTLEAQLAAKAATPAPEAPKPAAAASNDSADPEPDPNKFTDYGEYQKALIRHELKQESRRAQTVRAADEQKAAAAARAQTWQSRVSEASKDFADFDTVALNPDLAVTPVMADAITDTEAGARILYELGRNPDEAARIAKLPPVAQVREIGKLEAKLTAAAPAATQEEPQTPKPVVSKAPAPIKPVGGGTSSNPAKALDSITQAEYRALRESGKLR